MLTTLRHSAVTIEAYKEAVAVASVLKGMWLIFQPSDFVLKG